MCVKHRYKCLPAPEVREADCVPGEDSVHLAGQEPGGEDTSLTLDVNEDSPAQTLSDLAEMGDDYDNTIVGIEPGAGLMRLTQDSVIPTYGLEDWELIESSTPAMLGAVRSATENGENIAVTMWHPHWACEAFPLRDPEDDGWVGGHLSARSEHLAPAGRCPATPRGRPPTSRRSAPR